MHHILLDWVVLHLGKMYYTPGVYTANETAPVKTLQAISTLLHVLLRMLFHKQWPDL